MDFVSRFFDLYFVIQNVIFYFFKQTQVSLKNVLQNEFFVLEYRAYNRIQGGKHEDFY